MNIHGIFVGINKHSDERISELVGANNDARALWALFADTFSDLRAKLLLDEQATYQAVSKAILSTLESATSNDVIVISFAGHGSADGRLVLYDTNIEKIDTTTIAMSELAGAFSSTKAKAVLCILDCCFSGQAPARVLETEGNPRNLVSLAGVYGEGRVLLTACGPSESAWEHPTSGHGLLTDAVIAAFSNTNHSTISFPEITGEVITTARVAAERMGRLQTPEFLGHIQGGLTFPVLKRGDNFAALFPAMDILQMSGDFAEFAQHGIPKDIVDSWVATFPSGMNDLQMRAVNEFGVLAAKHLLVVAPTSSGKTLVGEIASIKAVAHGKKAIFLLPYRALVNEKFLEFTARYKSAGLRVVRCSGDTSDTAGQILAGRYDIAFFTYEMFLNLALSSPRLLSQLGLVVVDEGQFITDPNRGITVELILTLLLRARETSIEPQLLILSAVIGKLSGFDAWLSIPTLRTETRPVPLVEGVLDRTGTFQFRDTDGSVGSKALLPRHLIVQRNDKPSAQDVIVPLARQLVRDGEKLLIFRNMRGPAQGCARYLAKELGLPPAKNVLASLPEHDLTKSSADLRTCLAGGTAFHNTNLLRAEREAIEAGYRNRTGGIEVLVATTTLAAGINTPASTVLLAENEFVGEDGRPFTIAEYKNMAGRAGRLGWNEIGKAIILAETPIERARLFQKYVLGTPEDVTSSFKAPHLSTWLLRLLTQVRKVPAAELPKLLVSTFGGYLSSRTNPDWTARVSDEIEVLTKRMLELGLMEQEQGLVYLSRLGIACGSSSLSFESSLRLVELMRSVGVGVATPLHVSALIQVLDELDAVYTPLFKKGQREASNASIVSSRYGVETMRALGRFGANEHEFWQRCKRAAIVADWLAGIPVEEIEANYTVTPFQGAISYGDIIRIADATRFHLRSAHQIIGALFPEESKFLVELDKILQCLESGLPSSALPLLKIATPLVRGQYLSLHNAGLRSAEEVASLQHNELQLLIGVSSAKLIASLSATSLPIAASE